MRTHNTPGICSDLWYVLMVVTGLVSKIPNEETREVIDVVRPQLKREGLVSLDLRPEHQEV